MSLIEAEVRNAAPVRRALDESTTVAALVDA